MRATFKAGLAGVMLMASAAVVQAGTLEGAAIGAGAGAAIAGPPGAVVGGVTGAVIGGPNIVTQPRYRARAQARRVCWNDKAGIRHCRWR